MARARAGGLSLSLSFVAVARLMSCNVFFLVNVKKVFVFGPRAVFAYSRGLVGIHTRGIPYSHADQVIGVFSRNRSTVSFSISFDT